MSCDKYHKHPSSFERPAREPEVSFVILNSSRGWKDDKLLSTQITPQGRIIRTTWFHHYDHILIPDQLHSVMWSADMWVAKGVTSATTKRLYFNHWHILLFKRVHLILYNLQTFFIDSWLQCWGRRRDFSSPCSTGVTRFGFKTPPRFNFCPSGILITLFSPLKGFLCSNTRNINQQEHY